MINLKSAKIGMKFKTVKNKCAVVIHVDPQYIRCAINENMIKYPVALHGKLLNPRIVPNGNEFDIIGRWSK